MSQHTPTVLEIDRKLRDDFRRRVKDFGVDAEVTDPLLAVLFRTFAQQIDQVYGDTSSLRKSLLHELMAGLQVQQYLARPAQTVVRLLTDTPESKVLRAGTELNALASSGERLGFGLDATFEVSQARIAFALSYQDQSLRLISGVEMSDAVRACRPSMDAVSIGLGPHPALYLAIENMSPGLLSRHGMFFELGPGTYAVQNALCHEPWWAFGRDGDLNGFGLMRPRRINSGVYTLDWQTQGPAPESAAEETLPEIPDGFYSGRQFIFPAMKSPEELLCRVPRLLEPALARICGSEVESLLRQPRLWIKVSMPPGIPALHHAVSNILLHTMTASNIFCRNQSVHFKRDGVSIPVVREGSTPEFLVAPLSVTSAENDPYESGLKPQRGAVSGWYELYNNRLTLHPGHNADGSRHTTANVRLWLTNGKLGNHVGPGDITGFANAAMLHHIRLAPVTAAAGGSNGEDYAGEERRFSSALLTRGRIVTRKDLEEAALALDRRILSATTRSAVERRDEGLRRVEHLQLTLDSAAFTKPGIELPTLRSQIELSLRSKLVQGLALEVSFQWS